MFLSGADRTRYGKLIVELENDFQKGHDNYPKTLTAAYQMLSMYRQWESKRYNGPINDGVAFANIDSGDDNGRQAGRHRNVTCHKCGKKGHYANQCRNGHDSEATMVNNGVENDDKNGKCHFQFMQHDRGIVMQNSLTNNVSHNWSLLDNQSTVDVFCNGTLLNNIRQSNTSISIHCNAGVTTIETIGELKG
jgi:Zinc knuckle